MKKVMAMIVAAGIAGVAAADIAVNVQNSGGVFTTTGGSYVDSALVQLVWNASAPATAPGTVDATLSAAGDIILSQFTTTSGYAGTWSDLGDQGGIYSDTDVSGTVTSGYLTLRVFDASALSVGSTYLQFDIDVDGSLTEYSVTDTTTIYQTDTTLGGDIASSSYEVVPEPATIGLMGIAGLGMFLARRKARR